MGAEGNLRRRIMMRAIRRTPSVKGRILTTLVAVLALVAQPMYGLVAGQVASAVTPVVSGEFTNPVADYRNAADYKGITVAVRYKSISGLKGLSVTANRTNGGSVTKEAKQARIDAINSQGGVDGSVTAPIIVQQGSYVEADSSSWQVPTTNNVWSDTTVPTQVVITMTFSDSSTKSVTLPIGTSAATYAQIAPPAPVVGPVKNVQDNLTFPTIQAAINAATTADGETLEVSAGTYNESVVVNKSLTIKGAQAGVDAGTRTIDGAGESIVNGGTQTAFTISANNVTLNGLQVMQTGNGAHTITTPDNYSGITLENNIVTRTANDKSAMHLYGGQNFTIRQNYFSGIYTGIVLRNGNLATPVATNQKIIDNKFDNVRAMTGGTIVVYGQTDLEIARNAITTTFQGISIGATGPVYYKMHGVNVHDNTINLALDGTQPNVNRFGVLVEGMSEGVVIKNNTIKQTGVTPSSTTSYGLVRVSYDDVATTSANPTGLFITENDIESTASDRSVLVGKNITNQIDASKNWWGSQANPASKITSVGATANSDPWLCQSFRLGVVVSVDGSCAPPNAAPTLTVATPAEGTVVSTKANGNKLKITGIFKDDVKANYATMQLVKDGNSVAIGTLYGFGSVWNPAATYAIADGSYTYNLPVPAGLADGEYSLFYTGTDFAGGITARMERKFVIDNTDPTFAITSPANNSYVSGTITINAEVKDANDITKLLMNVGGQSLSWTNSSNGVKITRADDIFSATIDTTTLPEGPVYVSLRGTDGAGNTRYWNNNAAHRQHVFYVDNTPPTVSIDLNSLINPTVANIIANDTNLHRIDVSLRTDGDTTVLAFPGEWTAPGSFNQDYASKLHLASLPDGEYTIRATANDAVWNTTNASSVNFIVDRTAPAASLKSVVNGDGSVSVLGTIADVNLSHYWLTITKDGTVLNLPNTNRTVYTDAFADESLGSFTEVGTYTVKLEARDKAGNKDNTLSVANLTFTINPDTEDSGSSQGGTTGGGQNSNTTESSTGGESPNPAPVQLFTTPAFFGFGTPAISDGSANTTPNESTNTNSGNVLGEQDKKSGTPLKDTGEVLGVMDHKWFGIAWYWYLIILAALVGGWLFLAAAVRRSRENEA